MACIVFCSKAMQIVYNLNVCQFCNLEKLTMATSIGVCSCRWVAVGDSDRTVIIYCVTFHFIVLVCIYLVLKFGASIGSRCWIDFVIETTVFLFHCHIRIRLVPLFLFFSLPLRHAYNLQTLHECADVVVQHKIT